MSTPSLTTAAGLKRTSLWFVLIALGCLLLADIEIVRSDPWQELGRIGMGLLTPDFLATESLLEALFNTLAFALLGVVIATICGFCLALLFHWRAVRYFCSTLRAVHELFWALIFLQVFGLTPLTGILAIAIPYSGIFAKVYAEILEESDPSPWHALANTRDRLSSFFYARFAIAYPHFRAYCLYRLECGIRSSAILGFIGLPTLGFHLDSAFKQGDYSQAAALLYLFFILIATLRHWMRLKLLPLYLAAALALLPPLTLPGESFLLRFVTQDIVPAPLRAPGDLWSQLDGLAAWSWHLLQSQGLEGIFNTLVLSLIALVASGIMTLLLFPLVSTQFCNRPVRLAGHGLLVVFRSIPELLLAFIGTLILGPSMLPAIFALGLHNGAIIGYLVGQYSNTLQLRDDACRGLNRYGYEILPRIYPQFLAFLFYRWEVIMRETAILGILGIHTLGFYIDSAFEDLRYDRAFFLIIITAALNLLIDGLSRRLRARVHPSKQRRESNC